MAKTSVIVPIYNTEDYLKRCLTSLENQTECDIEFLLINDGSTDNSLDIMEVYHNRDPRFKIFSFTQNEGVSIARNKGIEISSGKYIGFVDSDDYIDPDYYEKLLEVIDRKNSSISISETALLSSFEAGDKIDFKKDETPITLGGAYCWHRLFKRDLIGEDRFLKHCRFEDIAFTFLMQMKCEQMAVARNTKYHYCMDNKNSFDYTERKTPKSILDLFRVTNYLEEK